MGVGGKGGGLDINAHSGGGVFFEVFRASYQIDQKFDSIDVSTFYYMSHIRADLASNQIAGGGRGVICNDTCLFWGGLTLR